MDGSQHHGSRRSQQARRLVRESAFFYGRCRSFSLLCFFLCLSYYPHHVPIVLSKLVWWCVLVYIVLMFFLVIHIPSFQRNKRSCRTLRVVVVPEPHRCNYVKQIASPHKSQSDGIYNSANSNCHPYRPWFCDIIEMGRTGCKWL